MSIKKIAAFAAAVAMAAGICTGVLAWIPAVTVNAFIPALTTRVTSGGFVIERDENGCKYVAEYIGKGGDIKIPSGVVYVGEEAFIENDDIISVTFPSSCRFVGEYAFARCLYLKNVVFEGNVSTGLSAFENCVSLESVTINGSVTAAFSSATFYGCQALETVEIKGNEYEFQIGGNAFQNCYSLKSINIPDKCTDIYGYAFVNCFELTELTIPERTKINKANGGTAHFGCASLFRTEADLDKFLSGEAAEYDVFVADGKRSGYIKKYNIETDYFDYVKFTPKQLTLTVTKGSPAEKWAKANKVKYVYAKTTKTTTTKK